MRFSKFRFDSRRVLFLGVLALSVPLAVGCGGKGKVSGTVTLDGQPLPAGTITFVPSKGPGAAGKIEDGKYSVTGVPVGKMTVTVETDTIKQEMVALAAASQPVQRSGGGRMTADKLAKMPENARAQFEAQKQQAEEAPRKYQELQTKYRDIPQKYAKADSSGLTVEVKSGSNTFDAPLSSK
jgi:hypothetical protein